MITLGSLTFHKRVGYFGNQKSFRVILGDVITWALVMPEVACALNRQSISDLVDKVLHHSVAR